MLRFISFLSASQATDRAMGMNGMDVAGLRPFDLVIPFTIQKGEITGIFSKRLYSPSWLQFVKYIFRDGF